MIERAHGPYCILEEVTHPFVVIINVDICFSEQVRDSWLGECNGPLEKESLGIMPFARKKYKINSRQRS